MVGKLKFGDVCGLTGACEAGLICMQLFYDAVNGFCTKKCVQTCEGALAGTSAQCVLSLPGGGDGCHFLCKASGYLFNCPSTLKCATTDNPPGSGQHWCEVH